MARSKLKFLICPVLLNVAPSVSEENAQLPRESGQTHMISRVIDGDTVELLMEGLRVKVRLIAVDTPETVHPQKPVEYYGKEASTFTTNLLRGQEVLNRCPNELELIEESKG